MDPANPDAPEAYYALNVAAEWKVDSALTWTVLELRYRDATRMGKIYLMPAGVTRPIAGWDEQGPDADDPSLTLDEWRKRIAAVVHVDGTARVQTVREQTNPMLYRLLKEFDALTGVPVLINTSFNIKGEPIVETPGDAVNCFLTTGVDHLVIHDTIVSKGAMHKVVAPLVTIAAAMSSRRWVTGSSSG